jgi:uncharacterized protein (DUF697 family)/tellurite resistance protein
MLYVTQMESSMHVEDQKAILAITLHAAFADGLNDDREREEVRRIADTLAGEASAIDMRTVYQDVLLKRNDMAQAAERLSEPGLRHYAYEMAVCVCEADGQITAAERAFLDRLRGQLSLDETAGQKIERDIDAIVAAADGPPAVAPGIASAEIDQLILNHALLNGALELLPQSWASMAIIPLQIKMVYGIGKAHGVSLDQGHIKEFIATAGVGLTSQYLEQFGRKLLGGLLGKMAGNTVGRIGRAATGMALSFATTYALGHLAKHYYAGGRQMNAALMRETYQSLLGPARELQSRYMPQIEQKAATLDAGQVMALLRT